MWGQGGDGEREIDAKSDSKRKQNDTILKEMRSEQHKSMDIKMEQEITLMIIII